MLPPASSPKETRPDDRLANDDALGPLHARECAELSVAAFDELLEERRCQSRFDARCGRNRELTDVAPQGAALRLVMVGNVDHE